VAVDRERGIVYSFGFFDHAAGKSRYFKSPDGRDVVAGPTEPWTWQIAELFKVEKGKIRRIGSRPAAVSLWHELRMEHVREGHVRRDTDNKIMTNYE